MYHILLLQNNFTRGNAIKAEKLGFSFSNRMIEIRSSLLKKKTKMSTHFAEIPKLLDEINCSCRSMTSAYSKATNNTIVWVSLDGIFTSVSLLTCLSLISAKPPAEIPQQSNPQLCPASVCRWQPFTRYRLLFPSSSPINIRRSLCTAHHIHLFC